MGIAADIAIIVSAGFVADVTGGTVAAAIDVALADDAGGDIDGDGQAGVAHSEGVAVPRADIARRA